jgi:hypothetical protein
MAAWLPEKIKYEGSNMFGATVPCDGFLIRNRICWGFESLNIMDYEWWKPKHQRNLYNETGYMHLPTNMGMSSKRACLIARVVVSGPKVSRKGGLINKQWLIHRQLGIPESSNVKVMISCIKLNCQTVQISVSTLFIRFLFCSAKFLHKMLKVLGLVLGPVGVSWYHGVNYFKRFI